MKKALVLLITIFILTACDNWLNPAKTKTVSYYSEHPNEMEAKMKECKEDATKLVKDPNCINASEAWNKRFVSQPFEIKKNTSKPPVNLFKQGK